MVWLRPVGVLLFLFTLLAFTQADAAESPHAHGGMTLAASKGDKCIRETGWMRRNHMDFLRHKRAIVVREGVRVKSESFLQCATCHPKRADFCDKCHNYVGVSPDCFECHNYE